LLPLLRVKDRLFYGWVVVIAFLITCATLTGITFSFGVFFKSIESEFNLTRTVTSSVLSANMILAAVFAVLGGYVLDRYGPRIVVLLMGVFTGLSLLLTSQTSSPWQLFLGYSLLLAIGTGAAYTVAVSTTSRWFDKKRGFALGITGSGAGVGTLFIAPFATYLISSVGWRMAYIIMGLIAWLIVIPLSRLLKKTPSEIEALPDGAKSPPGGLGIEEKRGEGSTQLPGFSLIQASRTSSFWLFGSIWLLYSFSYLLVLTHVVPHAMDNGIPALEAATVLSLMAGSNIAGKLLIGRISDSTGRKVMAIICALLLAGAMIWLNCSHDLWMFYLFGIVCGFSFGGLDPSLTALIGDTFGLRSIGMIIGTLNIGWGVGAAVGPAVGGLIFDVSKSYFVAFLTGALAMLALALLVALIRREETTMA